MENKCNLKEIYFGIKRKYLITKQNEDSILYNEGIYIKNTNDEILKCSGKKG